MAKVNYSGYSIDIDPTAPRSLFEGGEGPDPSEYIANVTLTEGATAYNLEQVRGDGTKEAIGSIDKVDMSDFITADELEIQLKDYATEAEVTDALESYPTRFELEQTLTNYETKNDCTAKVEEGQRATEAKLPTVTNGANTPKLKKITAQGDNLLLEDENGNVVTYKPTTYPVQLEEGQTILSGKLERIAHSPNGEENIEFIDNEGNFINFYGIPDPNEAAENDVLTVDNNGSPYWAPAATGGGGAFEELAEEEAANADYLLIETNRSIITPDTTQQQLGSSSTSTASVSLILPASIMLTRLESFTFYGTISYYNNAGYVGVTAIYNPENQALTVYLRPMLFIALVSGRIALKERIAEFTITDLITNFKFLRSVVHQTSASGLLTASRLPQAILNGIKADAAAIKKRDAEADALTVEEKKTEDM